MNGDELQETGGKPLRGQASRATIRVHKAEGNTSGSRFRTQKIDDTRLPQARCLTRGGHTRTVAIAILVGATLLAGCSHSPSAVPRPLAHGQWKKNRVGFSGPRSPMQFTVLHSFHGTDGMHPNRGLIQDASGNLYGTASGLGNLRPGVVFKLDSLRKESLIFRFHRGLTTGRHATGELIQDASGNFYGTTVLGGSHDLGVVFKLDPAGKETILHSFTGPDGANPAAELTRDSTGTLYGSTINGGDTDRGVVFKLSSSCRFTVLHSFTGPDGAGPLSGVIRTADGDLFGTTIEGGKGHGVVFKIDATGHEIVLYAFSGGALGETPSSALARDSAGDLFGSAGGGPNYDGVAFELEPSGIYRPLHSFSGPDGNLPSALVRDPSGNLYGTTRLGGSSDDGVVFELDPSGNETVLHSFSGMDGFLPSGSLFRDAAGNLYGATDRGGSSRDGVLFELSP